MTGQSNTGIDFMNRLFNFKCKRVIRIQEIEATRLREEERAKRAKFRLEGLAATRDREEEAPEAARI